MSRIQAPKGGAYSIDNHFYEGGQFMPDGVKTCFKGKTKKKIKELKRLILEDPTSEKVPAMVRVMDLTESSTSFLDYCIILNVLDKNGDPTGIKESWTRDSREFAMNYAVALSLELEVDLVIC